MRRWTLSLATASALVGMLALGVAGSAGAATLDFTGTLSLRIGTFPALAVQQRVGALLAHEGHVRAVLKLTTTRGDACDARDLGVSLLREFAEPAFRLFYPLAPQRPGECELFLFGYFVPVHLVSRSHP